ncbi:MAG: xanthine dehydrogenase family protein molybdopterin-binding subunit [Nitratireductor sp.]|nr:xanthine dehydrogenase family protein molybdopterin-binding subunit [Nitratireductor sp.]
MSRLGTIARRSFLIGSTAILGGVAFGYYWYRQPGENPLLAGLGEGEAALTPYVLIDQDGVTLITPRADKGQGAYSIQAALIAEELDVDLARVRVDPGVPSATYYNTALSGESVPFRSTDHGFSAELTRGVADGVMKLMGLQLTGGSSTVPDQYKKLRIAGAVARETLKKAASEETGIAVGDLTTGDGAVILPDGKRLSYEQLASRAAKTDPVLRVHLRPPSEWRYIGKAMQRIDIAAKSTGTQIYGIDLAIEGMVHATVKRNPRQNAGMNGYDASEAEAMAGVRRIVPVSGGVGIVADNSWIAFQAADKIRFEWAEADYPPEMSEHWQSLSDSFSEAHQDSRMLDNGDLEAALSGEVLEAEYRAPYLAHAPLEPMNAIVRVTDERVDVWTGTQIPRFVQENVAKTTGHAAKDVHVHVQMMGGSFGHRLEDDYVRQTAEIALALKGTPVKMTYSREEDFAHDYVRQIAMGRMRGAVKDGGVDAYDLSIAMPSIITSQMGRQGLSLPGPDATIYAAAWDQPYLIPNYRMTAYRAKPLAPISSWRSVGASTNAFFHEGFLNELIRAAGADPLEERLRLIGHEPSRKTLEAVGEMASWGGELAPGKGRGVAFSLSFGVPTAEIVEVTDTGKGIRIDKVWVAAEVGKVLDPVNFENLVQGGVVFGLGHAMNCEITYSDGAAEQTNYHAYEGMRLYQCPQIFVRGLENGEKVRGIGEPPVPPAAPALADAIFAATGTRLREMPFNKFVDFV